MTTLKTLALRLQAAKVQLEEMGEETDTVANSTADLRAEILALTKNKVDILEIDGESFKSTYKILEEISAVWKDINSIDRAALLDLIAGKRNANVAAAIINNFDIAQSALESSINAEGSAIKEYEQWMDSIQAKTQQFTAQFQSLSGVLIEQDWIKDVVDMGTGLLKILTDLTEASGSIPLIITALSSLATIKNTGLINVIPDFDSDGYELNITKYLLAIRNAAIGITSKKDFFKGVGNSFKNGLLNSLLGSAAGTISLWDPNTKSKFFDNILAGFESVRLSGDNEVIETFWKSLVDGGSVTTKTATALRGYFDTVETGEASLHGFNKYLQKTNEALNTQHRSAKLSQIGMTLLSGALNAAISLAFVGIVKLINKVVTAHDTAIEKAYELTEAYQESVNGYSDSVREVEKIRSEFETLSKGVGDSGENLFLTNEQFERYKELTKQIADISPELVIGYDAEKNAIIDRNGAIDKTIEKLKEQIELERALLIVNGGEITAGYRNKYEDAIEQERKASDDYNAQVGKLEWLENDRDFALSTANDDYKRLEIDTYYKDQIQVAKKELRAYEAVLRAQEGVKKEIQREHFESYGMAWLESDANYSAFDTETQTIVNRVASSINALDGSVENYEVELLTLIQTVGNLGDAQTERLKNIFTKPDDTSYLEYIAQIKNDLGYLPEKLKTQIEVSLGITLDDGSDLVSAVADKTGFGSLGKGGIYEHFKSDLQKYVESLSEEDLKIIIGSSFELEFTNDTTVEQVAAELDRIKKAAKEEESVAFTFNISNYSDDIDRVQEKTETLRKALESLNKGELTKSGVLDLMQQFPELIPYINLATAGFGKLGEGLRNALTGANDGLVEKLKKDLETLKGVLKQSVTAYANATNSEDRIAAGNQYIAVSEMISNMEITIKVIEDTEGVADRATGALDELQSAYDTLASVVSEYNSNGSLSVDTFEALLEVEDEYLKYLSFTEEGLVLNTQALEDLMRARVQEAAINRATQLVNSAGAAIAAGEAEEFFAQGIESVTTATWANVYAQIASLDTTEEHKNKLIEWAKQLETAAANVDVTGGSPGSTDPWKDEFESYLSELEFMRDTNKISEQQYYTELNRLNEKYFANNKKYLDDYRKYYVEVYDYLLQRQEDMLNAIGDAAQKALDKQLKAKDDEIAARQEIIDAKREELNALEEQYEKEDRLFELQKARDNYNKIAANKNTRLYTRDKGWIYTADPHALQEAKDRLDELEKENERAEAKEAIEDEIKALEDEIKVIEKEKEAIEALKDKWSEATDNIGKSLDEYMLDMQLTTEFTKMSYDQMSKAVLQYAMLTKAAMGGKLLGNGFAGFENIYGATSVNPLMYTATPTPIVGGANTGATNVVEEETNRPTGAGATGIKAYIASKSSNTAQPTNRDEDKMLKIQTDTEKNTSNSYETSIQLFRLGEDTFMMEEDAFAEQYDLTNALYNTTLEDLENAYDTNEGVWSLYELFVEMMENGIKTQGGGFGGGSGIRGFIGSGGLEDGGSESTGVKGKRSRERIYYEDMTDEQKARAERMAYKYGLPVEEIRMYDVLSDEGTIIVGQDQLTTEDQQMVSKGWADSIHDLTEEMYEEYRRPWTEEELRAQQAAKIMMGGRARGSMSIGRSGLYNVDEQGTETIIRPQNGRVTWLEQGDRVYTAPNTKRNYDMTDLFERVDSLELLKRNIFDNPIEKLVSNINGLSQPKTTQAIPVMSQEVERSNDIYISGCDFNMPNVTDRESFIRDLTRIAKYK